MEPIVASSLDTSPRYQKVARDDVRVHFEKEGPDMMFMQRPIGDETLHEELRNKLEKVVNRRCVVRRRGGNLVEFDDQAYPRGKGGG